MSFPYLLAIALGLAMDAFAVSTACGVQVAVLRYGHVLRVALAFGFFQFMMPVIGWLAGSSLSGWVEAVAHWIAFGLLIIIGLKMIYEAFSKEPESCDPARDPSRGWPLLVLALATSIDALAVGLSIGVLNKPILIPSIIIGAVCSLFSIIGIAIGNRVGALIGKRGEAIGGLMLIAIGIRILVEHLAG